MTVSSACVAAASDWVISRSQPERGDGQIHAGFRDESRRPRRQQLVDRIPPSELVGLDVAGFRASGARPLRFAIIREAGRLDCSGNGGNSLPTGNCSFTADPAFTQLLISRGIGRPTREQAFGLMALNVRRETDRCRRRCSLSTPTIDDLMALTALGVNGNYIGGLAHVGYRPRTIHALVEFKALGITPEWIGGFVRAGYANLPADELVQLKALNITPDFIAGFDRIGYRNIPAVRSSSS